MATTIYFLVSVIILYCQIATGSEFKPQNCLDIKRADPTIHKNGYYTIHGDNQVFTVYCDFNSEPPFVWTLIESFSREMGKWSSTLPGHQNFQRAFTINAPFNECRPDQWKAFRLSLNKMKSIYFARSTSHWRATCNFDLYAKELKYVFNRTDYIRTNLCHLRLQKGYSGRPCAWIDYVNIRGYSCRKCLIPMWFPTNQHVCTISSLTQNYCQKIKFPNYAGMPHEYNFGTYNGYNRQFSCTTYPQSTTNWWYGGIYDPKLRFTNIKHL